MRDDFHPDNPDVDIFIKKMISEFFAKFNNKDLENMMEDEITICKACEHYYPTDPTKQESLAFCVMKSIVLSDPLNYRKINEDVLMPLAIELGVEDAFAQEIINIKNRKIIGEENN